MTVAAGILTMLTTSNWWSFAMAAGFIAALLIYGNLLIRPGPVNHGQGKRLQGYDAEGN